MSQELWYFLKGGQAGGPIEFAELVSLIKKGEVLPHDMVFKNGTKKWKTAREWEELQSALNSSPEGVEWDDQNLWVVLVKKPPEKGAGFDQKGPFTTDQVRESLENGSFTYSDFAWKNGEAEWKKIGDLPELNRFILEKPLTDDEKYIQQLKAEATLKKEQQVKLEEAFQFKNLVDEESVKLASEVEKVERPNLGLAEEPIPEEAGTADEVKVFVEKQASSGGEALASPLAEKKEPLQQQVKSKEESSPLSKEVKDSSKNSEEFKVLLSQRTNALQQLWDQYKDNKKVVLTALGIFIVVFIGSLLWSSLIQKGIFDRGFLKETDRLEIAVAPKANTLPPKESSAPIVPAKEPRKKKEAKPFRQKQKLSRREADKPKPKVVSHAPTRIEIRQGNWRSTKRYLLIISNGTKDHKIDVVAYSNIGESVHESSFFKRMRVSAGREKLFLGSQFRDGQYRFDVSFGRMRVSRTFFVGKKNKKFKQAVWMTKKNAVFDHLEERKKLYKLYSGLSSAFKKHPSLKGGGSSSAWAANLDRVLSYKLVTDRAIDKKLHPQVWLDLKYKRLEIVDIIKAELAGDNVSSRVRNMSSLLSKGVRGAQELSLWK